MRGTRIALVGSATLLFALGCSNPLEGILGGTSSTEVQVTDPTAPNQVGVQMGPNGLTVQGADGQQVQISSQGVTTTGGVTATTTTAGQPQSVTVSTGTGGVQVTDGSGTVSVTSGTGGVRVTDGTSSVNVGSDGSVTVKDGTGRAGTVKVKGRKKEH